MSYVPTLLIGVGGTGGRIVDQVYSRIPVDRRRAVAVHVFDTDVNDIVKLERLRGHVTQTSPDCRVDDYLYRADPSVRDWFPHEMPEVRRKLFTEGAGQIRAVSRLAYYACIEDGRLQRFGETIRSLLRQGPDDFKTNLRVMLVGTLAGGTGSGLFLQVAMYLRWLVERELGLRLLIRGGFLLPDVLVKSGKITGPDNIENVYANVYAAMKELEAIRRISRDRAAAGEAVTVELEYMPNQLDASGRRSVAIPPECVPLDFTYLYDFENSEGRNLVSLDNYERQIIDVTYLQLFSPMSGGLFSKEDNDIIALAEREGRNRYGSAGVARLVYPYRDIIRYCALEWAVTALTGQWVRIDEAIEEERRQRESDLVAGLNRPPLVTAERYVALLRNLARGEQPDPMFGGIYRSAHAVAAEGRIGDSKCALLVDAVDREIERTIADEPSVHFPDDAKVDPAMLRNVEHALSQVSNFESALASYETRVMKFVTEARTFLVNRIVAQDCNDPNLCLGENCRLNTWLLKPEPLHPVAVRFVLYEVQLELEQRLADLAEANATRLKGIRGYGELYDNPDTPGRAENAEERLRDALEQGRLARLLNNQFKSFVADYETKSNDQLRRLRTFRDERLKELVYAGVLDAVRKMLEQWERYFRNLRDVRSALLYDRNVLAAKHDGGGDETVRHVYASREAKRAAWESLRGALAGTMLPTDISRQIYLGQYRRFCAGRARQFVAEEDTGRTAEAFESDVMAWCEKQLLKEDSLDLDVIAAIRKEAEATRQEPQLHIEERVRQVRAVAKPLGLAPPQRRVEANWGVHPRALAALTETQAHALFGDDPVIADDAFSRHELWRYTAVYGLTVDDLPKFFAGNERVGRTAGAYYMAYKQRVEQLVARGNTVTPHIDKRWHLPAYLPDINAEVAKSDLGKVDRAFLVGLAYGMLLKETEDGREIWIFRGGGRREGRRPVVTNGKAVRGLSHLLHDALALNPAVVDGVLSSAAEYDRDDREKHPGELDRHGLWKQLSISGLVGALVRFPAGDPARPDLRDTVTKRLLPKLFDVMEDFAKESLGRSNAARTKCVEMLHRLKAEAVPVGSGEPGAIYADVAALIDGEIRNLERAVD